MEKLLIVLVAVIGFSFSANAQNVLTFYAWNSGTNACLKSDFGHTYVCVEYNCYGYRTSGMDYETYEGCAKMMVSFNISDAALSRVNQKIREWQNNPVQYSLGRRDCTSFAMDVADAAGISYGSRSSIQWPIGFLERLRDYNSNATYRRF